MEKQEKQIELGNLYEINQQLVDKLKPLTESQIDAVIDTMGEWFDSQYNEHTYYMLLCNEMKDYTVFKRTDNSEEFGLVLKECLVNRGTLLAIDEEGAGAAWEIWIRMADNVCHCYYLFPYDEAVIEVE